MLVPLNEKVKYSLSWIRYHSK